MCGIRQSILTRLQGLGRSCCPCHCAWKRQCHSMRHSGHVYKQETRTLCQKRPTTYVSHAIVMLEVRYGRVIAVRAAKHSRDRCSPYQALPLTTTVHASVLEEAIARTQVHIDISVRCGALKCTRALLIHHLRSSNPATSTHTASNFHQATGEKKWTVDDLRNIYVMPIRAKHVPDRLCVTSNLPVSVFSGGYHVVPVGT